ncbi:MAG: magnesium transporter [Candidatus Borkfalkiaceae bacterium]|nr:magnesium transporter [Christensenellaceae bacterium]
MNEELEKVFERLKDSLDNRKFADLRIVLLDMEPADIANFMEEILNEKEQIMFFRLLPKELASDVFIEIDTDMQENLIKAFTDKELKEVIDDMFLDDTVDVIEEMPANVVKRILRNSDPENRKQINELLEYPEDTAGSIMTPEFVALSPTMTVDSAFEKIRQTGLNKETIYTCYVTDKKKHLIGVVTVKDMLLASKTELIADVMDSSVVTAETLDDKEEVAMMLSKYDYLAIPIIDKEGCLVGIVTVDDAVDVIQEEATEDIQKMAAMLPTEKPYLKQSVWRIWLSRIPWLLLLMVSATFTGLILNHYEAMLPTVLIACVPMLMDTAGNAGGQSSVTIIRSLALNELSFKDFFKVVWKELRVSIICAVCLGAVCFLKLQLIDNLLFGFTDYTLLNSFVISLALSITVIMAKFIGCILPLFAKLIHLDPAVVASPFITTIVDALSLLVFVGLSIAVLGV